MKKIYWIFLLVPYLYLSACSSGKKALEQGNYYEATLKAINRLRGNPNQKKARSTLRESYPLAVNYLETQAKNKLASNDPSKWRQVLGSYQKINHMYDEINRAPGALQVIPNPVSYFSQMEEARNNAAEEVYQIGIEKLALNNRTAAKEAFYLFQEVNNYVPGYKDVNQRMDEAHDLATLKVLVDQIPVPARYSLSGDFFQAKIEEYVHNYQPNEFVRFYSMQEAQNENLQQPDHYIRIAFDDFVVGETHIRERTEEFSKDSVKVGEVTLDNGTKVPAYATVKAKLTTIRKEVSSRGLLSFHVVDAHNDAVITTEKFPGEFVWFCEWGSFNGDERALTQEQLQITKASELQPPSPQDLFFEFTRPIYDQVVTKIRSFYGRY